MTTERESYNFQPPKVVVGTGWWCTDEDFLEVNPDRKRLGSDKIREVSFFDLWLRSVRKNINPDQIIVVDSASPIKPRTEIRQDLVWVELLFNAKHSTNHEGRWSGWTRSVLLSAQYAMVSDCDYFAYVEQDCLLSGHQIVERAVSGSNTGVLLGDGKGTPQPIQQSFFIISKARLPGFISNLACLNSKDMDLSPEWKFVFATSDNITRWANFGLISIDRLQKIAARLLPKRSFDFLPFGYGRSRPIGFDDQYFYFQQGTEAELARFLEWSER